MDKFMNENDECDDIWGSFFKDYSKRYELTYSNSRFIMLAGL